MTVPFTSPTKNQNDKKWLQFLIALPVTIVAFSTGFHTGWPAPSIPKLLSTDFPFPVTNEEASYITIIAYLGNISGGLLGSAILDKIGRKKTILLIPIPQLISYSLIILSHEVKELLYLARLIGGLAEGLTFTIVPLYISEIAEPNIRGALGTMIPVLCILGTLYVNLVGSYLPINITAATFLVFPVLFLILFWKMPESPYYLIMKKQEKEAELALKFLRRRSVSDELSMLVKDVNRQMSESGTYRDIFQIDSNRKAFFLVIGTRLFQQLTGISAFALYVQVLLSQATDAIAPHIGATILLLIQLIMAIVSTVFVDRWGRKPLLLFSTAGCCINLLVQAIFYTLKERTIVDVSIIDWFPLLMMILFVILFSCGLGMVVNIITSEMFSASIKGKCVSLANIVFAGGMMATTKFYQATADSYGLMVPYWSFGLCSIVAVVFLYFSIPETKGKTLEEIQQFLKGNKSEKK